MSGIRGKDTKPELVVRRFLHSQGFRFRLHRKDLPGRPDIVLPRYKVAIFVNGCFWHGHQDCNLFKLPSSNTSFWQDKISKNRLRDRAKWDELQQIGWSVVVVWECAVAKKHRLSPDALTSVLVGAIRNPAPLTHIRS
ncbi:very short patch repair endonuclease [Qipengyuania sp. S6317L1]|nr:very short patch repair endonuclease [Qipengyuania sp. S6317L1]